MTFSNVAVIDIFSHSTLGALIIISNSATLTMTDMYEEPKAMEADGNLQPYGHEERGSEVSFYGFLSRFFAGRRYSVLSHSSTFILSSEHLVVVSFSAV